MEEKIKDRFLNDISHTEMKNLVPNHKYKMAMFVNQASKQEYLILCSAEK